MKLIMRPLTGIQKALFSFVAGAGDVGNELKCEELNVSKSSPICPTERPSMRRAATSLMGLFYLVGAGQQRRRHIGIAVTG